MNLAVVILAAWLSSSDSDPLIYTMIGAVLGVYLFIRGFRALQRKRLIMDTPTAKVRSAAIGLVELQGAAVGPFTFTAPITRVPCFYHRTELYKWVQRGKSSEWEKIADECRHVPFYLKDPTGMVLVDPNGAEMELHCDFKQEFHHSLFGSSSIPGPVAEFMGRYGVGSSNTIKIEEHCIKPDNALFILGTLAT
ncbi:MAG TPA: GIDE domain-containing protein, partial [Terriglobales bacterium]|nr:GIDE domain-containing protein [Terriglobales bacterium]